MAWCCVTATDQPPIERLVGPRPSPRPGDAALGRHPAGCRPGRARRGRLRAGPGPDGPWMRPGRSGSTTSSRAYDHGRPLPRGSRPGPARTDRARPASTSRRRPQSPGRRRRPPAWPSPQLALLAIDSGDWPEATRLRRARRRAQRALPTRRAPLPGRGLRRRRTRRGPQGRHRHGPPRDQPRPAPPRPPAPVRPLAADPEPHASWPGPSSPCTTSAPPASCGARRPTASTRLPDAGAHPRPTRRRWATRSQPKAAEPRVWAPPLTTAELRVLCYLPTHLSYQGIAEDLFVSRNTIKSQAIAIYRKLHVTSRQDAVARARELGLLDDNAASPSLSSGRSSLGGDDRTDARAVQSCRQVETRRRTMQDWPTVTDREATGKDARKRHHRSSLREWAPAPDRRDPIDILEAQATTRVPELVPIRYGRMAASAFAFYRGGAAIMAADLAAEPHSNLRVQLCGDAHLANFGGFASPERSMVFDINDFDETHPGPFEWDLQRLAASIEIAARNRAFDPEHRDLGGGAHVPLLPDRDGAVRRHVQPRPLVPAPRRRRPHRPLRRGGRRQGAGAAPAHGHQGPVQGPAQGAGQADRAGRRRAALPVRPAAARPGRGAVRRGRGRAR